MDQLCQKGDSEILSIKGKRDISHHESVAWSSQAESKVQCARNVLGEPSVREEDEFSCKESLSHPEMADHCSKIRRLHVVTSLNIASDDAL